MFPPVIYVKGESLPEAWENAYLKLAEKGLVYRRKTKKDFNEQITAVMLIEVANPDTDPFSQLKGGTNAVMNPLLDYYYEIMGAKHSSAWEKKFNAKGKPISNWGWNYTYFSRLTNYPTGYDEEGNKLSGLNQIEWAIDRLIRRPSSRRTNIITWYPLQDTKIGGTPCLQRIWFESISDGEKEGLDMHYEFRSRNVLNASFGNMQALYLLGCHIRDKVEKGRGKTLNMRIIEYTDSFHVNSKDYPLYLEIIEGLKDAINRGELLEKREEVINQLLECKKRVELNLLTQTKKYFEGDLKKEEERIRKIGGRIFCLLKKYASNSNGNNTY